MKAQQVAKFIELRRRQLESELLELTGYHVQLSASVHSHIDNTNTLACDAAKSGFQPKRSGSTIWLESPSGETAVFVSVKGQA